MNPHFHFCEELSYFASEKGSYEENWIFIFWTLG